MSNKVKIGGDRLGAGGKSTVDLKTFNRSNHNLSKAWRSSMSAGTLVPFYSKLALVGDVWDIDLECDVKTLPTIGPLFGSYKVQLDLFLIPVRLWNAKMHMNKLKVGNDMSELKFPMINMEIHANNSNWNGYNQVNDSCILSYLGIRGLGRSTGTALSRYEREFNAIPYLCYWATYKQYYANKQENRGMVIHNRISTTAVDVVGAVLKRASQADLDIFNNASGSITLTTAEFPILEIFVTPGSAPIDPEDVILKVGGADTDPTTIWGGGLWDYGEWKYSYLYMGSNQGAATYEVQTQTVTPAEPPAEGIQITEFPLDNIDEMTMDILSDVKSNTAFIIDKDTYAPYGLPLETQTISEGPDDKSYYYSQEGLGLKTYQADLFNNWIDNEWIDSVNSRSAVSTAGNSFSIDALNIATKVYDLLNAIAISGGSLDDWQNAVYATDRTKSVESPMYMGGLIKELAFEEVVSQSAYEGEGTNQPLGQLAGRGFLTNKHKGGKVRIKVDETSWIMGIASITPRVDYSQGNDWQLNLKTMADVHVPHLDQIGFQDLPTDQMAWFDTEIDPSDNSIHYKSVGKVPAWINYMTDFNTTHGKFADLYSEMFMTLNRRYEQGDNGIADLTTYIDPAKFNNIFAEAALDAQNFWVQIGMGVNVRRIMSAKVMPNL